METLKLDDNLKCGDCGRYGAVDFGERKLCPGCYEACDSCGPKFDQEEPEAEL